MGSHISRGAAVFLNWRAVAILQPAACFSHIQGESIAAWLIATRRCIQVRSKVRHEQGQESKVTTQETRDERRTCASQCRVARVTLNIPTLDVFAFKYVR